ncbi:hypothetical protein M513_12804, partial [Trichuris suis]
VLYLVQDPGHLTVQEKHRRDPETNLDKNVAIEFKFPCHPLSHVTTATPYFTLRRGSGVAGISGTMESKEQLKIWFRHS